MRIHLPELICRKLLLEPINYISDTVAVCITEGMGRGVFATVDLPANTLLEVAPVIVMGPKDRVHIDKTLLHDYIFEWGEARDQCCMALGYVPLYNHSYRSNCTYEMHFEEGLIMVKTVRAVKAGEELFINYNGEPDDDKPLWFAAQ